MSRKQATTKKVTLAAIMTSAEFERGLSEVRKGVAFDWRDDDWDYERGRQFGCIAPLNMPLRVGRKLNPKALKLAELAFGRRLLI